LIEGEGRDASEAEGELGGERPDSRNDLAESFQNSSCSFSEFQA